jgi:transcription-repair coupling factor (superfamily II helicase)
VDAHLPVDYVAKEELRLEAYRRLAAVTTQGEVADIRAEWEDRYGPVPPPAEALIDVARLRAECVRIGVREVVVTKGPAFSGPAWTARIAPLRLRTSQTIRLRRLSREAVYKEDLGQVQLPVKRGEPVVDRLVSFLRELVPEEEPAATPA